MRRFQTLVLLCIALLVASCASTVHLQRAQADALAPGASADDVDRALGKATALAQVEVQGSGQAYLVRKYQLQTGTDQQMSMVCTPVCIPIFIAVPVTADYAVIQRLPARTLMAWGTLEELSKDSNAEVSGLMPEIKRRLQEAAKK